MRSQRDVHAVWVSPEQLKTGMATMRKQALFWCTFQLVAAPRMSTMQLHMLFSIYRLMSPKSSPGSNQMCSRLPQ